MDISLVGESAEAGNGVVERSVDLDGLGDKIPNFLDHVKLVLALDVLRGRRPPSETTKRSDFIALVNS